MGDLFRERILRALTSPTEAEEEEQREGSGRQSGDGIRHDVDDGRGDQGAQTQFAVEPRTGPPYETGKLLCLPHADLPLQLGGLLPPLGDHRDEDVQLDGEEAEEGALRHLHLSLEGLEDGRDGERVRRRALEGVQGSVHLLPAVEESQGAGADRAARARWRHGHAARYREGPARDGGPALRPRRLRYQADGDARASVVHAHAAGVRRALRDVRLSVDATDRSVRPAIDQARALVRESLAGSDEVAKVGVLVLLGVAHWVARRIRAWERHVNCGHSGTLIPLQNPKFQFPFLSTHRKRVAGRVSPRGTGTSS